MRIYGGKQVITIVVTIVMLQAGIEQANCAEVGLYFDSYYTECCMPNQSSWPVVVDAYLVLTNYSETSGVAAWEGAFDLPQSVVVSEYDFGQGAVNYSSWPEFTVGYSCPRPAASNILLMSCQLVFLSAGEIYFHNVAGSVSGDPMLPSYVAGVGGDIYNMGYAYGSPVHPIASVGVASCPVDSLEGGSPPSDLPDWEPLGDVGQAPVAVYAAHGGSNKDDDVDWGMVYQLNPLCVRGIIRSVDYDAYWWDDDTPTGAARMVIDTSEVIWGGEQESYVVWCRDVEIPAVIHYPNYEQPDLSVGQEIVFAAGINRGYWLTSVRKCFNVDNTKYVSGREYLSSIKKQAVVGGKYCKADVVVLVEPKNLLGIEERGLVCGEYSLIAVYKGSLGRTVKVDNTAEYIDYAAQRAEDAKMLLYLRRRDDGVMRLVDMQHGCSVIGDVDVCGVYGSIDTNANKYFSGGRHAANW